MRYDIIGDIHGQADKLEALLRKLGYEVRDKAWRHPERIAIFVGDFIDLGEKGVETYRIVRGMVEADRALAVMGNHELNAIAWHTPDPARPSAFLRRHHTPPWGRKNRQQHNAFLKQVKNDKALHTDIIDWFLTLPLWLDLPDLRVVHACWHEPFISWLSQQLKDGRYVTRDLMVHATTEPADKREKDNAHPSIFKAVEAITKGMEIPLPEGITFTDKYGIERDRVRARWWDTEATTFKQIAKMTDEERGALPDEKVPAHTKPHFPTDKPIFFGHYWMSGIPRPQSATTVCVDYSAGHGGPLVAYRWDAGSALSADQFVWV